MTTVSSGGAGKPTAAPGTGRAGGPASSGAWRATWLLLAFMLINFADKTVLGLAATPMMHDLHITHAQYGQAAAAFFALFSLAALGVSALTRRVSTTRLLLVMAVLWSAAQLPMLVGGAGFGVLVGTRVLLGAAEGPAFPVATHSLYTWFADRDRSLPTSVLALGSGAGVAIAAPVLTAVITHAGWRWGFGVVGIAGLLWAALWCRFGQEGPEQIRDTAVAETPQISPVPHVRPAPHARPVPHVPLRRILLTGTWIASALAAFAAYWQTTSALTWGADYLRTVLGMTTDQAGLVTMGAGLTSTLVLLVFGVAAQRARRAGGSIARLAPWAGGAAVVAGLALAAFAVVGSHAAKVALTVGPCTLSVVILVISQAACARIAPAQQRGVVLGALAFVYSLAGVLAPLVVGQLTTGVHLVSGYRTGYLLTAAMVAVSGVLVALLVRPERDAARLGIGPQ
ncbi:MFS transporter [Streptacidiphilus fuscans]|uniref:MFS transporter n=1 Tax=Streptacidiphilus fuscans TaxID=2789292 RepID=A0A931FGD4_9ACTN|nr:MFS transporter [Streptacidiphilus fuscans]MBF9073802.1 MFS transporter [Streptacidiphilus fuscans]